MYKNGEYYRAIDLDAAALEIKELGEDRGNQHEVFSDALNALWRRCEEKTVLPRFVEEILGKPDRIRSESGVEIWEYDSIAMHGPFTYSSVTPFHMVKGICIGTSDNP